MIKKYAKEEEREYICLLFFIFCYQQQQLVGSISSLSLIDPFIISDGDLFLFYSVDLICFICGLLTFPIRFYSFIRISRYRYDYIKNSHILFLF